ncbi:MAG: glycosyltransferase [Saprospiraceae bacterium]|nr:glycosyltransferase [Saprospiraceae bacterium]
MRPVLLITPGFTADEHDRNCLPTLQLYAEALHQSGRKVLIVSLDYPFHTHPYTWKGIPVFPCGGRNKRWLKPLVCWRAMRHCHALLDANPDAVLHSFWLSWPCAIGQRVAARRGARHITTLMGQDALPENKKWFRFLNPNRKDHFVVLSTFHQNALKANSGFEAGHIIPWGIDVATGNESGEPVRNIDVVGAGSLIPLKNWEKWLGVIALLKQEMPSIKAVLIGDGPEKMRLQERAERMGLAGCVQLLGEKTRPEVLNLMKRSKVLLHTSDYESQGFVFSEAAMSGCALVSTPVGLAPDIAACSDTEAGLASLIKSVLAQQPIPAIRPPQLTETLAAYGVLYDQ